MFIIILVHLLSLSGAYLIPAGHEDGVDFESGAGALKKTTVSHAKNTGSRKRILRKKPSAQDNSKTEPAFKPTGSEGMYACMYKYVCMYVCV
jgi:hypothetical protein